MRRVLCLLLLAVLFVSATASTAFAEEAKKKKEFNDRILVLQRKPFLRKGRVELTPTFHGSFNDSLVQQITAGVNFNYHLNEWLYFGLTGGWQDWRFLSRESTGFSGTYERVIDATDAIPEASVVNAFGGAQVGFVPFYGKFSLFQRAIVHWDTSVGLGGGLIHSRANQGIGGGIVNIGQRFFILDWLSLSADVRGLIYYEELNKVSGIFTQWQAGLGVSFWLPTSFEYEAD